MFVSWIPSTYRKETRSRFASERRRGRFKTSHLIWPTPETTIFLLTYHFPVMPHRNELPTSIIKEDDS